MPDEEGVPRPDENQPPPEVLYGNSTGDRTAWLVEFVRTNYAEHFSTLYDLLPPHAVEVAVRLTLQGISNDIDPDSEEDDNDTTEAPQAPD